MKSWLRRAFYFLLFFIWLLVLGFPILAVSLAAREQIQIGDDPQRHVRLFLIQESDERGVGIEWARQARPDADCTQTTVVYLMWRGNGENVRYCRCYDASGALLDSKTNTCTTTQRN